MQLNENIKEYWEQRADKLNERAVGYADQDIAIQDALYEQRKKFIFDAIDPNLATIDFGCGIGRYSKDFTGNYLGLDMTKKLIDIAIKNNPNKIYKVTQGTFPNESELISLGGKMYQFFTATVLQHCPNKVVENIFHSIYLSKLKGFTFYLYENSMNFIKPHIVGRYPEAYCKMIQNVGFCVYDFKFFTHIVKSEEHSLTIVKVR